MRNHQKWAKSDIKLAEHSLTKGLPRETIEQLKIFFHQNMSHIISLKVTKFQQPLLITLGVADEKPEGGGGKKDRVTIITRRLAAGLLGHILHCACPPPPVLGFL